MSAEAKIEDSVPRTLQKTVLAMVPPSLPLTVPRPSLLWLSPLLSLSLLPLELNLSYSVPLSKVRETERPRSLSPRASVKCSVWRCSVGAVAKDHCSLDSRHSLTLSPPWGPARPQASTFTCLYSTADTSTLPCVGTAWGATPDGKRDSLSPLQC